MKIASLKIDEEIRKELSIGEAALDSMTASVFIMSPKGAREMLKSGDEALSGMAMTALMAFDNHVVKSCIACERNLRKGERHLLIMCVPDSPEPHSGIATAVCEPCYAARDNAGILAIVNVWLGSDTIQ